MIKIKIFLISLITIFFNGCYSLKNSNIENTIRENNSYIITKQTREDNIVHYGQYAEIWIAPYKDNNGDLYADRVLYFWVEEPDFKIGEKLSYKANAKTIQQNAKHKDFAINDIEFRNENSKDMKIELNKDVKEFLKEQQ